MLERVRNTGLVLHFYPHRLVLLPSPCTRGEGLGVGRLRRVSIGFFDREFNVSLRFRSVNK